MKAVVMNGYGGSEVLNYVETARPIIKGDEVLLRVHAAAVNPVDLAIRQGYMSGYFTLNFPFIPGCDASGIVEEIGQDVKNIKVGDEVYARLDVSQDGAYAEFVAVKATEVVRKPASLDHVHAAAVPHAALTAWQAIFNTANLSAGQTILIHGAAGGVGHLAVQFAKWRGARVIATASSSNQEFLHQLGADVIVDYNKTRFEDAAKDVDVVFDTIGGETQERSWGTLRQGGTLVSIVQPPSEEQARAHGVKASMIGGYSDPAILKEIGTLIDDGRVKPYVTRVFPLADARQAQEAVGGRHTRGKIVLQVLQ